MYTFEVPSFTVAWTESDVELLLATLINKDFQNNYKVNFSVYNVGYMTAERWFHLNIYPLYS